MKSNLPWASNIKRWWQNELLNHQLPSFSHPPTVETKTTMSGESDPRPKPRAPIETKPWALQRLCVWVYGCLGQFGLWTSLNWNPKVLLVYSLPPKQWECLPQSKCIRCLQSNIYILNYTVCLHNILQWMRNSLDCSILDVPAKYIQNFKYLKYLGPSQARIPARQSR